MMPAPKAWTSKPIAVSIMGEQDAFSSQNAAMSKSWFVILKIILSDCDDCDLNAVLQQVMCHP